jgi:hypothetical protein
MTGSERREVEMLLAHIKTVGVEGSTYDGNLRMVKNTLHTEVNRTQ